MANYWAIAIGIDQYQQFQPLMYAQRDAQALRSFLTKEANVPAKQCFLLTDSAARRQRTEAYPSRDKIHACITRTCQQRLQAGDFLWCFFSGYGVQFDGKDYLLPIDANPERIAETGIPIELLFSTFETAPTPNIMLVLDVNRSSHPVPGPGFGDQTALLAREHGIPTLLSCLPDQLSHETLSLRQGLFTAALLEGLRHQGWSTIEQLVQYLSYRLPELSQQYWRPQQDPLAIVPSDKRFQLVLPETRAISVSRAIEPFVPAEPDWSRSEWLKSSSDFVFFEENGTSVELWPLESQSYVELEETAALPLNADWRSPVLLQSDDRRQSPSAASLPAGVEDLSDSAFWRRVLTWSSLIAAALLIGVVVRNAGKAPAPNAIESPSVLDPATGETSSAADLNQPTIQAEPGSTLESAYLEVRARNFLDAKQFLDAVPASQRNADFDRLLAQANKGLLSDAKIQLARTRELTSENQAADFVEAIALAQLVRADEPQYQEAQQYIERWSQVILDMAQGRAERRNDSSTSIAAENYGSAITTARMVPTSSPEVYQRAQEAIDQWSQQIFDLAQDRADEAKYDVAVQTAEIIPSDVKIYPEVQAAIAEWQEKPSLLILPTP